MFPPPELSLIMTIYHWGDSLEPKHNCAKILTDYLSAYAAVVARLASLCRLATFILQIERCFGKEIDGGVEDREFGRREELLQR